MYHPKKIIVLIALSASLLFGCNANNSTSQPTVTPADIEISVAGSPSIWIDAPLNGMVLKDAPYEIVLHATAPKGIASVDLQINDQPEAISSAPDKNGMLWTYKHTWDPNGPGEYLLRAIARDINGQDSDPSEVRVIIVGETPTPTPTSTPTLTLTPTSTVTATVTPTQPVGLELVDMTRSSDAFYNGACSPNSITFTIRATDPDQVKYMYFFYRLQDKSTGQKTDYNDGLSMNKVGTDTWSITIKSNQLENYNKYDEAWFIYQFTSQSADKTLTRSQAWGDVNYGRCSGSSPQNIITITPTIFIGNPWE